MWRHTSIAVSRLGQLPASALEIWPLGQIVPPWWNRLPFVAVIAASVVAIAATVTPRSRFHCQPCHGARGDGAGILFQRGNVPTASFQHDTILGATGAAAVSH